MDRPYTYSAGSRKSIPVKCPMGCVIKWPCRVGPVISTISFHFFFFRHKNCGGKSKRRDKRIDLCDKHFFKIFEFRAKPRNVPPKILVVQTFEILHVCPTWTWANTFKAPPPKKKDPSLYVFPDNKHIGWTTKPHLIGLALSQGPPGPFSVDYTMSSYLLLYSVNFYLFRGIKIGGGKEPGQGFWGNLVLLHFLVDCPFCPVPRLIDPRRSGRESNFSFYFREVRFPLYRISWSSRI